MRTVNQSAIEMKNITVEFPGVIALDNVDCIVEMGKVKALVGANGAGKSTLMKVLSGVYTHYTGEIIIDGKPIEIRSTGDAKKIGIEIVYQEVDSALVSTLSVAENVMMEHLVFGQKKTHLVNWKYLWEKTGEVLERLNVPISPKSLVSTLTLAQKQMVLIARAIMGKCRYLLLDEPTAPLSQLETQRLFDLVRQLKSEGVGIVFISHRLNELFEICDEVTVLRDGLNAGDTPLNSDISISDIVSMMLGHEHGDFIDKSNRTIGAPLLMTSSLSDNEKRVRDINMVVNGGEIVGLFGLIGAGKTELCKTLFGAFGKPSGIVELNGKDVVCKSPADAVRAGFAFIPEERRKEGVVLSDPVYSNLSLVTLSKYISKVGLIRNKMEYAAAQNSVDKLQIKTPSIYQKVAFLSGGNQQKVTIGKWLGSSATLYIFDEPTKGIDVKAKSEVYRLIVEMARKGYGIIYASSEQTEILNLTDRVYVMYDGTIQAEFITAETNEDELMLYSTGGGKND
jgi:simple sugar transport system ATP-binding protein